MSSTGVYFCNSDWNVVPLNSLIVSATSSSALPVDSPSVITEALEDGESCSRR